MKISRQLVLFCVERRKAWRLLQSKAGIENVEYLAQRTLLDEVDSGRLSKEEFFDRAEELLEERILGPRRLEDRVGDAGAVRIVTSGLRKPHRAGRLPTVALALSGQRGFTDTARAQDGAGLADTYPWPEPPGRACTAGFGTRGATSSSSTTPGTPRIRSSTGTSGGGARRTTSPQPPCRGWERTIRPRRRCWNSMRAGIAEAGVGVINSSWWGPREFIRTAPSTGLMDVMAAHDIQVMFHLEPYSPRRGGAPDGRRPLPPAGVRRAPPLGLLLFQRAGRRPQRSGVQGVQHPAARRAISIASAARWRFAIMSRRTSGGVRSNSFA